MSPTDAHSRIPYADHLKQLKWRQGEHVFLSGGTGSGKTTLARTILERRGHVLAFCIKTRDETVSKDYADYTVVDSLKDVEGWMNRVMIWPKIKRGTAEAWKAHQTEVLLDTFSRITMARGWTLFVDELNYMSRNPGIRNHIETLHYIGRSAGLTMVTAAQRPAFVPLAVLSNSSHVYIARSRVGTDMKRLADLANVDPKEAAATIQSLPTKHDFLYMPTQGEGVAGIVNTRQ